MLGAVVGDIVGSRYELKDADTYDFPLFTESSSFTDDTVLTVAVADAIMSGEDYGDKLKQYYKLYPYAGYGSGFKVWAATAGSKPYNSFGNGSAMRVSPVAYISNDIKTIMEEAKKSAEVSHNHEEGIKGAQALAVAIYLARTGSDKNGIREAVDDMFGYNLSSYDFYNLGLKGFDTSCSVTVPMAIVSFLDSESFEDAIRQAISKGGDSDTIACMAGAIAEPFYSGVPYEIQKEAFKRLPDDLADVIEKFVVKYINAGYNRPDVHMDPKAKINDAFRSLFS